MFKMFIKPIHRTKTKNKYKRLFFMHENSFKDYVHLKINLETSIPLILKYRINELTNNTSKTKRLN